MEEERKFTSGIVPPAERTEPAWWFAFQGPKLLVYQGSDSVSIPCFVDFAELGLIALSQHYLGHLDDRDCYAVELAEGTTLPPGMALEGLRQIYGRLDEALFWVATRAVQIVDWDRTQLFCGRCATPLRTKTAERAKECPICGQLHFPRLAPAMIVLVERGRKLLLARSRHFLPGMYSVLAGFVEPGESLEDAVVREVKEEVGIDVRLHLARGREYELAPQPELRKLHREGGPRLLQEMLFRKIALRLPGDCPAPVLHCPLGLQYLTRDITIRTHCLRAQ